MATLDANGKQRINLYINPKLVKGAKVLAVQEERTFGELIEEGLDHVLSQKQLNKQTTKN